MEWELQYEKDVAAQTTSGPHTIGPKEMDANRAVAAQLKDIMPFADLHKMNDCDLIYRFLIAKKWAVETTVVAMREYIDYRKKENLDGLLWESFPEKAELMAAPYRGFDKEGHPLYIDQPDPALLTQLLTEFPRELLLRVHLRAMEEGRRLQKVYNTDRVTCAIDFSNMTMSIVRNTKALGFMKEMSHYDQMYYPENMRTMLICNGGWTFSAAYKIVKPWLDPRVQQKIHFMGGGANFGPEVHKFVEPAQLPPGSFLGTHDGTPLIDKVTLRAEVPVGTQPLVINKASHTKILFHNSDMPPAENLQGEPPEDATVDFNDDDDLL